MSFEEKESVRNNQSLSESADHENTTESGGLSRQAPVFQLKSGDKDSEALSNMENAFGADFSNIKIHKESEQATNVGALAYAQGDNIHFAPGRYNPDSSSGKELLGHELAHVVQQREGRVQANSEVNGMPLNDDKGLEQEADQMGAQAANFKHEI